MLSFFFEQVILETREKLNEMKLRITYLLQSLCSFA